MKKQTKGALNISLLFGCVCYVMCSSLLASPFPILLGIFTAALFFGLFYLIVGRDSKKLNKLLSQYGNEFIFKENVNYYGSKGACNGILFLMEGQLSFITNENKQYKIDFPIQQIKDISYGKVTKYMPGIIVTMQNGTTAQFSASEEEYMRLKKVLIPLIAKSQ